jgi:ribonuclease III
MPREEIDGLEKRIRHKFKNRKLLEEALTHKSYAMERGAKLFNERLEFLGDSILNAVVAHYYFKRFPDDNEGRLSKIKSQMVSRPVLAGWARDINLGSYLWMGGGEEATGGRARESLLANAFEALVGALFLEGGFQPAQRFVVRMLSQHKRVVETDYKSKLQELLQKRYKMPPAYVLARESGPDHAKNFVMEVRLRRRLLGQGEGRSKKEAEQAAARQALKTIRARNRCPRRRPRNRLMRKTPAPIVLKRGHP